MDKWLPIIISFIALLFSIYTTWVTKLKGKAIIKYRESWDIHQTPRLPVSFSEFVDDIFGDIGRQIFLIHTISISNFGNKLSDSINLEFQSMPDDLKTSNKMLDFPPYMRWEPRTQHEPKIIGNKIALSPLSPANTITLTSYIPINTKIKEITFAQIQRVERVLNGDQETLRVGEEDLEQRSIKQIQKKIQKEFEEIKSKQNELNKTVMNNRNIA